MNPLGCCSPFPDCFRRSNSKPANSGLKAFLVRALLILYLPALAQSAFAQANLTPSSLSFGNHVVGVTSATLTATFQNVQTTPLSIKSILISGNKPDYVW